MSDLDQSPQDGPLPEDAATGKGFTTPFLLDPLSERRDIQMLKTALRKRWNIPDELKAGIVNRLSAIVDKEYVDVMTKQGPVSLDGPADINSVAAARVLVMIEGQNQSDEQFDAKSVADAGRKSGDTYNIGCVGSIALGQEPISPDDAKRQAQEILERVNSRVGRLPAPEAKAVPPSSDLSSL